MFKKAVASFLLCAIFSSLVSCSLSYEPEAISGSAPLILQVQPELLPSDKPFQYQETASLSESFRQMTSLRLSICHDMYSTVATFSDDSAWVPEAANKFVLGSDEFLAASFVMETDSNFTTENLMYEQGFRDIKITSVSNNEYHITATKPEETTTDFYEYTVSYSPETDATRFTRKVNNIPDILLATRRITGGYAVEAWTPDGRYEMLAQDIQDGQLGYIPNSRNNTKNFPESDIYYNKNRVTSGFTIKNAEYTFLLTNNVLYITKSGSNYAIPVR